MGDRSPFKAPTFVVDVSTLYAAQIREGDGMTECPYSAESMEAYWWPIIRLQQDRILDLEKLLFAAFELYADEGYLVTKDEWLETLRIQVKGMEE